MENLVHKIIEIDQEADNKLTQAAAEKEQALEEIKKRKLELVAEVINHADERLAGFEQTEQAAAEERTNKIQQGLQFNTNRLQKIYDDNNAQWTQQLVKRVLNTNEHRNSKSTKHR